MTGVEPTWTGGAWDGGQHLKALLALSLTAGAPAASWAMLLNYR
jgi:hypothetical protein